MTCMTGSPKSLPALTSIFRGMQASTDRARLKHRWHSIAHSTLPSVPFAKHGASSLTCALLLLTTSDLGPRFDSTLRHSKRVGGRSVTARPWARVDFLRQRKPPYSG